MQKKNLKFKYILHDYYKGHSKCLIEITKILVIMTIFYY